MRIGFFGSGEFALSALRALLATAHDVVLICTRPPRQAGRGHSYRPTPVGAFVQSHNLDVCTPNHPDDPKFLKGFQQSAPDICILADYACILPPSVLAVPKWGFLNIHPSLLPRWRGAAPVQRAIMAGDKMTGVSIMMVNEKLDQGPVLMVQQVPINAEDTGGTLAAHLADLGAKMIVDALGQFKQLKPMSLDHSTSCYAHKIQKGEAQVDWCQSAEKVDCHIRGLSPFPGAWSLLNGERIKILSSCRESDEGKPGELLNDMLCVACNTGSIRILQLQRPGKSIMDAEEFLRGFQVVKGDRFAAVS